LVKPRTPATEDDIQEALCAMMLRAADDAEAKQAIDEALDCLRSVYALNPTHPTASNRLYQTLWRRTVSGFDALSESDIVELGKELDDLQPNKDDRNQARLELSAPLPELQRYTHIFAQFLSPMLAAKSEHFVENLNSVTIVTNASATEALVILWIYLQLSTHSPSTTLRINSLPAPTNPHIQVHIFRSILSQLFHEHI
jgi:hypothetical protein